MRLLIAVIFISLLLAGESKRGWVVRRRRCALSQWTEWSGCLGCSGAMEGEDQEDIITGGDEKTEGGEKEGTGGVDEEKTKGGADLKETGGGVDKENGGGEQRQEPTETSKQPIRTCYLGHVTGIQPIRNQYFLIRYSPDRFITSLSRNSGS
eukprot:sb/3473416/